MPRTCSQFGHFWSLFRREAPNFLTPNLTPSRSRTPGLAPWGPATAAWPRCAAPPRRPGRPTPRRPRSSSAKCCSATSSRRCSCPSWTSGTSRRCRGPEVPPRGFGGVSRVAGWVHSRHRSGDAHLLWMPPPPQLEGRGRVAPQNTAAEILPNFRPD